MSVAFSGSRSLSPAAAPLVGRVVAGFAALAAPRFSVGCSAGADELVLSALVAAGAGPRVRVFAVGSASGAGFWSGSALPAVQAASAAGASVAWLAGGPLSAPLRVRLAARSAACVRSVRPAGSLVAFFASPASVGTLGACRLAAAAGLSVLAFPFGFAPSALPALAPGGCWVPSGAVPSSPLALAWRWSPPPSRQSSFW